MIGVLEPEGLELKAVIDAYETLMLFHRFHEPSSFELRISRHLAGADVIAKGDFVVVNADPELVFIVEHRSIMLTETGKQSEVWAIQGTSLSGLVDRRIILPEHALDPEQGVSHETFTGSVEDAMHHFVYYNLIAPRAGTADPTTLRTIAKMALGPSQSKGGTYTWSARFQNLRDYIEEMSKESGIGWRVVLDYDTLNYVFECYEGTDRTRDQLVNDPVVIAPEFGSAQTLEYSRSTVNMRNTAYVAAYGEGADRVIVPVEGEGDTSGLQRRETFIDARDLTPVGEEFDLSLGGATGGTFKLGDGAVWTNAIAYDASPSVVTAELEGLYGEGLVRVGAAADYEIMFDPDVGVSGLVADFSALENASGPTLDRTVEYDDRLGEIEMRGLVHLAVMGQEVFLKGQVHHAGPYQYKQDYFLGDLLTVQNKDWGVSVDGKITEVHETYQQEGYAIELTFGFDSVTILDVVRRELKQSDPEVRR